MESRLERDFNRLGFAVGVRRKIYHFRSGLALSEVIFLITRHAGDVEALHEIDTLLTVSINDVIDRAFVSTMEDSYMEDVGADKRLFAHADNLVFAVLVEDDDIVNA